MSAWTGYCEVCGDVLRDGTYHCGYCDRVACHACMCPQCGDSCRECCDGECGSEPAYVAEKTRPHK